VGHVTAAHHKGVPVRGEEVAQTAQWLARTTFGYGLNGLSVMARNVSGLTFIRRVEKAGRGVFSGKSEVASVSGP
jgi:hypothetical protein